jgi:hypothetical protein
MKLLRALAIAALAAQAAALAIGGRPMIVERDSDGLQDIVSTSISAIQLICRMLVTVGNWRGHRCGGRVDERASPDVTLLTTNVN